MRRCFQSPCLDCSTSEDNTSSMFPAMSVGFTIFGEIFCICDHFFLKSNHRCSHIPSSGMVHAGCGFVASIHLSRTWNACVHRLDRGL